MQPLLHAIFKFDQMKYIYDLSNESTDTNVNPKVRPSTEEGGYSKIYMMTNFTFNRLTVKAPQLFLYFFASKGELEKNKNGP